MALPARHRLSVPLAVCLAVLLLLAAVVDTPLFAFYRISGNSMLPAFSNGDRVLVTTVGRIGVGDAVIAELGGETLIKRVVGVPGDTVELYGGLVIRNGVAADPVPQPYRDGSRVERATLGEHEYYVLGDHRAVSVDSRMFGPIDRANIIGRVVYRWFASHDSGSVAAARD